MARARSSAAAAQPPTASPVQVELRPVAEIAGYERNAKRHSPEQVQQIAASMLEFGWTVPILVNEEGIIAAGHGRLDAAESIWSSGGTIRFPSGETVPAGHAPVIVARGWSEQQFRSYVLADNRIAENATWDDDMLKFELSSLFEAGIDTGLLGFSASELDTILNGWIPDADKTDIEGDTNSSMTAVFKVRCDQDDKENVGKLLRQWVKDTGIQGLLVE